MTLDLEGAIWVLGEKGLHRLAHLEKARCSRQGVVKMRSRSQKI
jgi:hypothetical protein